MKSIKKKNTIISIFKDDDIKRVVNTMDKGLKRLLHTPYKKKIKEDNSHFQD